MKISVIDTGFFKLDGGAMFGVVPKKLWERFEQPDAHNLCTWAMRCLLIETEGKKILIDTGIGNKQDAKFFSHFQPHGEATMLNSLKNAGVTPDQITDVFLTHLHFDHVGGALFFDQNKKAQPVFPNARYWTNQEHFDWAFTPNPREKASFLKENFVPLRTEGILHTIESQPSDQLLEWLPNIHIGFAYGHTEAMMLPHIKYQDKTIVYCADLLPSPSHVGLPYVMSYDVRPLDTMKEKEQLLKQAVEQDFILFFEHAPQIEACTVKRNEKGRIVVDKAGALKDFISL